MLDRQKIEAILARRFPGAAHQQVAAAANAIMGLSEEWEEIVNRNQNYAHYASTPCSDACYLARELEHGAEFRLFRRREISADHEEATTRKPAGYFD